MDIEIKQLCYKNMKINYLVGDFKVRNEYSMAKLLCEIVISNTAKVSNLKYQIIRPFNISGARQLPDAGFVLPRFVTSSIVR
jgi:UDP-glucose 4-epimerase